MAHIVVTSLPHLGHLNPSFAIAAALQQRGHRVSFLAHSLVAAHIAALGFAAVPYRGPRLHDIPLLWHKARLLKTQGSGETRQAIKLFSTALVPETRCLQRRLRELAPDLLLNDTFYIAAKLAAESMGIPWVDIWSAGTCAPSDAELPAACHLSDPMARGMSDALLDDFDARLAPARRRLGLPPARRHALRHGSQYLQLVTSTQALELPHADPGARTVYIGPSLTPLRPDDTLARLKPKWLQRDLPLVYVALGNFFNRRADFFARIAQACAGAPWRALISTPLAGTRAQPPAPKNVLFVPHVRQRAVLAQVDLFVTHGGANSVNEAFAAGVPMLVSPVGGEQMYNARRVCALGAGRVVAPQSDAAQLRADIQALLTNATYRSAARAAQAAVERCDAGLVGASLIERILRTRAPIARPADASPSVYSDTALPEWAQ